MSLLERLKAEIAAAGPIPVDAYMTRCLHDPLDGYYATRPALGEDGDFITAPMVSQMFGELIGLWAVETWRRMGAPRRFLLVEMGPGDGTLMSDALRAAKLAPEFLSGGELWLVETSKPLVEQQRTTLEGAPLTPHWINGLADLPRRDPLIVVANEYLDCLPAKQFVRTPTGVYERCVGINAQGQLCFGLGATLRNMLPGLASAADGAVLETSVEQIVVIHELSGAIARRGGAALFIDYGRSKPGFGDTLQALERHERVDPLAHPGGSDLTVHVDFHALCLTAMAGKCGVALLSQSEFLARLGIRERAAVLAKNKPAEAARTGRQLERLTGDDQMGLLFKAACVHRSSFIPPGFEAAAWRP